ncbi:MAG TPA: TPM domain-containing protein, partial [Calditrichia bacterium]|nr:TPM domain-containing protein [Calditrichia bacterium]
MRVPVSIATLFPGIVLPVLLLVISLPAASQEALPDKPQSWVSDYAGVLSAPQKQEMDGRLADLQNRTSTQIFVAVFPEIPDGYALEDFCT